MPYPLIEGKNIRKSYGLQVVLDDFSFLISEKQKIALIGRNGAGKSTLLKILMKLEEPDGGEFRSFSRAQIGVVHQQEILPKRGTTLTFLEKASKSPDWTIRKVASQFGLREIHLDEAPGLLSGGYQMRVKLVAMLLHEPNLLLLDEPVNYLDLQTLMFLEKFLQTYKGAFLLAAHDRTFLQNTCTHTFEIERGKLTSYKGSVQEYLLFKKEQLQLLLRSNKKLSREIAHHKKFVDRFRYKASLASRAQNKMKHINRLRGKISAVDTALTTTKISIESSRFTNGVAVRTKMLEIGYNNHSVAKEIEFDINRGDKVVIAGENGRGKSTFLKTLAGIIPPLSGEVKWWHRACIGYYDQKTEATLKSSETILEYLTRMAPRSTSGEKLLMMAGDFLFKNDDLDKATGVLSGGERARLCLAGVLLQEHNVLLLDEPTNHLDVETAEALSLALKMYAGTVIIVSHARTFVNTLVDSVFEIRGGTIHRFMGPYAEYVDNVSVQIEDTLIEERISKESVTGGLSSQERVDLHRQIKAAQRLQERTENEIKKLETEKGEILAFFFENPTDYSPPRSRRLVKINEILKGFETNWLEAQQKIDIFRKKLT